MAKADLPKAAETGDAVAPLVKPRESAKLVWNSKPRGTPNPRDLEFQPAEVVYSNKAAEQGQELLIPRTADGEVDDKGMNRLIWGDNLLAMQALLAQGFAGGIDLIYIDPPFLSGSNYSYRVRLEGAGEVTKPPSIIERLAYSDTWNNGVDSYLSMLLPRLQAMRELLTDTGSIYVHVGPQIAAHVRLLMDEVFGAGHFRNEIIWRRAFAHSDANRFGIVHDSILFYTKTDRWTWNEQRAKPDAEYVETFFDSFDEKVRKRYQRITLTAAGITKNGESGKPWRGVDPSAIGRHWAHTHAELDRLDSEGRLHWPGKGVPRLKRYEDEYEGMVLQDIWMDVNKIHNQSPEATGFGTQKPEALLERILSASSNPGSLVADFFSGSGTTLVAAEKLGRRWIGCDLGKVGIQVARGRLVERDSRPFVLENIGNYQRELIYREVGNISLMQRIVIKLYGAEPHPAHSDLGVIQERGHRALVYVGYPDRPLTAKKTAELVKIARALDGEGYDKLILLAWDYEYNYDEQLEIRRRGFGVQVESRLIPPSIYEYLRKSRNESDLIERFAKKIQFGAKPYLKLAPPKVTQRAADEFSVSVGIERYILSEIPIDDEKDRASLQEISRGERFPILIDYWAVDWDYDGKTFRSRWQDLRGFGKSLKQVTTRASTTLKERRRYEVAVRVVDVFGNDATATTNIDLR